MSKSYTVQQGDHLSRIAAGNGFFDYKTVWNDPSNKSLTDERKDPHVLLPGDVLNIPDKQEKKEPRATGQRHRFQVPGRTLLLRLAVRDFDYEPLPNLQCKLEVDGAKLDVTTNGDGLIEQRIPVTAQEGRLSVPEYGLELPLKIGYLDPVDADSGWMARLINLGYYKGPPDAPADDVAVRTAVEEFQCDFGLPVTGDVDGATRSKLEQAHGA